MENGSVAARAADGLRSEGAMFGPKIAIWAEGKFLGLTEGLHGTLGIRWAQDINFSLI